MTVLRSNSPRLPSATADPPTSTAPKPPKVEIVDDQQRSESNDSASADGSEDSSTPSIQVSAGASSGQSSSNVIASDNKRKLSTDSDQASIGESDQSARKREADRRSKSDESTPTTIREDEPPEKKPKLTLAPVQAKVKSESSSVGDDLDGLACVVCKYVILFLFKKYFFNFGFFQDFRYDVGQEFDGRMSRLSQYVSSGMNFFCILL